MGDEYISRDGLLGKLCRRIMIPQTILEGVLADIPSADVAPVRHGRWIYDGYDIVCSECGTAFSDGVCYMMHYDGCYHEPKHCLWCGARMDGDDDE